MNPIVNFIMILLQIMPPLLRQDPFRSFVSVFGYLMNRLNDRYVYLINHSGQEASLEHYLNDQYGITYTIPGREADIAARRIIWINDGSDQSKTYIYNTEEAKPATYVYNTEEDAEPLYLYNREESSAVEFRVMVPSTLSYDTAQLKAYVNKYRPAGNRFTIITY